MSNPYPVEDDYDDRGSMILVGMVASAVSGFLVGICAALGGFAVASLF